MDHRRRGMVQTGDDNNNNSSSATDYTTMMEKDGVLRHPEGEDHDHHPVMVGGIQESHTRSIVKGLTWRVLATSTVCTTCSSFIGHGAPFYCVSNRPNPPPVPILNYQTTVIAYLITGEVQHALQIGFFEFFAKLCTSLLFLS